MLTGLLLLLVVQQSPDGVVFQCETNNTRVVYVAGDFNDWAHNQNGRITDPDAAMTGSNGVWRKVVKLEPGTWRFKFNTNGETNGWFAPDGEHDADGNAIFRVRPTGEVETRSSRNPKYRPQRTERGVFLQLYVPEAHIVYLAGSFNEWGKNQDGLVYDPQFAMSLSGGVWQATVSLPAGRYTYQFVIDGDRWIADPNCAEKDAEGHSVLEVK